MIDIKKVSLPLSLLTGDGPAIATGIAAQHPYRDGHIIKDEVIGQRVTVLFPGVGYQVQDVKVADPTDELSSLLGLGKAVHVTFDGFEAKVYDFLDKGTGVRHFGVSAKADAVRVVPAPGSADDLVIE